MNILSLMLKKNTHQLFHEIEKLGVFSRFRLLEATINFYGEAGCSRNNYKEHIGLYTFTVTFINDEF